MLIQYFQVYVAFTANPRKINDSMVFFSFVQLGQDLKNR